MKGQTFKLFTYQVEQGLPSNMTKAIYQDKQGFMWIGSDVGVLRYDGNNFMHLDDNTASPYIKSFFQSKKGELFVVHDMGIDKIINQYDTVFFSPFLKGHHIFSDTTLFFPKSIYEDSANRLWISEMQSVVCYKDGKMKRYLFDEKTKSNNYSKSFQCIEDRNGSLLVFSQNGYVFLYDEKADRFQELDIKLKNINGVVKLENGRLWLGSEEGIFELTFDEEEKIRSFKKIVDFLGISTLKLDKINNILYVGTWLNGVYKLEIREENAELQKIKILKYKVINDLYINPEGEVWVSADDGLAFLYLPFFTKAELVTDQPFIHSISAFNRKLYIATANHIMETITARGTSETKELFTINPDEQLTSMAAGRDKLFFCTNAGFLYKLELPSKKLTKTNLTHLGNGVLFLSTDSHDNLWICQRDTRVLMRVTSNNKWIYYNDHSGITSSVFVIKETYNGIYCGGEGDSTYLYKYDEINDYFVNISKRLPFKVNSRFIVRDLCMDKSHNIYMGTGNHGLIRYHKDRKTEKINLHQKREIHKIRDLMIEDGGEVWIGTDFGLICYYDKQFLLFDEYNGVPSNTISHNGLRIDQWGQLWVGTANGAGHTQKELHQIKKTPMPTLLTLKMNGNKFVINPDEKKNTFKNNSFLEASFASLIYPSKNITYQYRVIGLKENWIPLNHNELTIPQLTTGKYTLEIRASKQGEYLWSDPLSITFIIELPWFLHWWAFIVFGSIFSLIIWLIVKLNSIRLIRVKQRLESIIQKRTSEIVNQKEEITMQRDAIEEKSIELENALNEIKGLNATKDRFFSIVAHDLRGPLNSLSAFSSLLIEHTDSLTLNDIQKVGTQLNKEVKNTIELTENLLTWARAQMKQSSFKPVNIELSHIISQNILLLSSAAQNKGIELCTNSVSEIMAYADIDHVNFIIRNLVSNAIKFTFPGGIIHINTHFKKEGEVEVSIIDTGVGMSEIVLKKLFDIDSNHSTKGTEGEKGTGLGLSLCRDFVKINGGAIWVESEVGKGSTFYFTLKIAA